MFELDRIYELRKLIDKYEVKKYVADLIGEEYIIAPTIIEADRSESEVDHG